MKNYEARKNKIKYLDSSQLTQQGVNKKKKSRKTLAFLPRGILVLVAPYKTSH